MESWSRGLDPREVAFEYSGRRGIYERIISLESSRQGEIDRLWQHPIRAYYTISVLIYYWLEVCDVLVAKRL